VPETYTVKRTVYKVECRQKEVDSFRCETVQVQKERVVSCVKRVPVVKEEVRKVCRNVTTYEDREVCKKVWRNVEETVMKKKLVRLGHWECCEVEAPLANLFHKCRKDPCDPCAPQCCAPKTRTKKRWVHCPEYQYCPETRCRRVCVDVPTVCKVPVCKQVWEEADVQVCRMNRVEEKKTLTYTVCVPKTETFKATRTVRVCVPHEEEVTCTRMVARTVERQVAVEECAPACAPACTPSCETTSCRKPLFCRLRGHGHTGRGDCCH